MQTVQLNAKSTRFGADGNVILLRTGGLPTKPRSDQLFGAKGQRPRHLLADCKLRKTYQGILQKSSHSDVSLQENASYSNMNVFNISSILLM
uniref:Uncharacterized protein n=1 Tax=Romanomermis culicivorax TaxID=13658 RepID=A0A915LAF7_ROMCU